MRNSWKRGRKKQAGYVLLAILFLLVLLTLALMAVAPTVARQIQRDREEEMIHRGQQYARAIRKFYKKTGRYPNSVKDLLDTNHLRFLRQEYKDPMTADGKWRLLHVGEVQITPTGFFGQSLQNVTNSSLGTNVNPAAASNPQATPGTNPGTTNPSSQNSGLFSSSGQTFGSGPVVGVSSFSKKQSLKVLNGKDHYNDWQFVYDPRMEQVMQLNPTGKPGQFQLGNTGQTINVNPNGTLGGPNPNPDASPLPK
jgi:type II secretory pathway pseudopilin PulG